MFSRNVTSAFAAVVSLAIGSASLAQPAQNDRNGAPQQQPSNREQNTRGQQAQTDAQDEIDNLLDQIAADPKTSADKLFILTAALHTQSELQMAKEVAAKTQNPQVKKLADQMIDHLSKTNEKIQQTAQAVGLQLPTQLAQAAVQEVHIIAALPADQLDKQYTARVQSNNAEDQSRYQSQAQIAQDQRVRQFARDQASGMQQQSADANQAAQSLEMSNSGEARPAGANIPGNGR
jgi:putative membrane protein